MRNANHPGRRLAAAVLLGALLTVSVPVAAQAAEEPVPTASAGATVTAVTTAMATASAGVVTVGAGELIAIGKVQVLEPGTDKTIAQLAIGDRIKYSSFDRKDEFNASYTVVTDMGQHGTAADSFVVAMPAKGLALDQHVEITKTAAAKSDVLSMMGGPLGAAAFDVFSAPTGDAEVIGSLLPGQKYLASKPMAGATSLFGSSQWIAIKLDPTTDAFSFIHAESAAMDEHPEEAAIVTTPEPTAEATDDQSAEATEPAVAEVTASAVAVVPAAPEKAAEAPATKKDSMPVIGLGAGAVVLLVVGAGVMAKRKRAVAAEDEGEKVAPTEPAPAPGVETVDESGDIEPIEASATTAEDHASYWDEED